jgi:drug/metabolite transporter (DMT)-like permease
LLSTSQVGLLAALAAASIWSCASILFSAAGRELRPSLVNLLRLLFALGLMFSTHLLQSGTLLPEANGAQWFALSLSGVIGLGLGDLALFYAFDAVGPRLAMLVAASAPVMAALLGLFFLGETLGLLSLCGMALTLFGITWVVLERAPATLNSKPKQVRRGIIFGLLAAAGQAIGVLFSKQGMTQGVALAAQDAALIRMLSASAVMLPLQLLWWRRQTPPTEGHEKGKPRMLRVLAMIAVGSLMGTYLGMSLSLVATRDASLGKAQTILSLPPVLILPLSYYVQKEHISARAVLGALLAAVGTALLFTS